MDESISIRNEDEKLVVLQALETFRALQQAVKDAPHGQGLAFTEAVVRERGFEHLRTMYQQALKGHPEAQKKGSAPGRAAAAAKTPSAASATNAC